MAVTLLAHPLVIEVLLPFLLVFTVVFAILQKTEILGKGKKQIDSIVALVVALIAIAFGNAVGIMVQLTAFLAVSLVVILVFLILWGSVGGGKLEVPKAIQWTIGVLAAIAVVIAVLVITGAWDFIIERYILGGDSSGLVANVVFVVVIVGAVIAVLFNPKDKKKDD